MSRNLRARLWYVARLAGKAGDWRPMSLLAGGALICLLAALDGASSARAEEEPTMGPPIGHEASPRAIEVQTAGVKMRLAQSAKPGATNQNAASEPKADSAAKPEETAPPKTTKDAGAQSGPTNEDAASQLEEKGDAAAKPEAKPQPNAAPGAAASKPAATAEPAGKPAEPGSVLGGGLLSGATPGEAGPQKGSALGGALLGPVPPSAAPASNSLIFTPGAPPPEPSAPPSEEGKAAPETNEYRETAEKLLKATSEDAKTFEQALTDADLRRRLEQTLKTPLTDEKLRALADHAKAEAAYWQAYRRGLEAPSGEKKTETAETAAPPSESLPFWSIGKAPPPAVGLPPPSGEAPEPSAAARPQGVPAGSLLSRIFPLGEVRAEPEVRTTPWPLLGAGQLPERPAPLIEIGNGFLSTGPLSEGFEIPGGAVWQPRLWIFGTYRTALQTFEPGPGKHVSEWANRLDLFANLQLTGTERLVVGLRPFDRDRSGAFSGVRFTPSPRGGRNFINANVQTLFFEGDLGSTIPHLNPRGNLPFDFGYTIGRQPLFYQNGMLINDTVDMVGITRNSLHVPFSGNLQLSGFYAGGHVRRPNRPDHVGSDPILWGLAGNTDVLDTTYNLNLIRVEDNAAFGDAWYGGVAAVRRFGLINTTLRLNGSLPDAKPNAVSTKGMLVSLETSFVPFRSDDLVYFNPYVAVGNFTQASRDPIVAGPLGGLGISYAAYGIGTAVAPLSSAARDVGGFALGYQAQWDNHRRSLTLEFGLRREYRLHTFDAEAVAARFQQALGQRVLVEINASYSRQHNQADGYGLRTEFLYQF